ncbi:choice-of-anchor J domain-containing protein [Flavobacteriaceae bacterium MJ-SS4]|uniref:choice-of-anchor J domain-containing protein n=1 Tax=Gilvirhabdus luticola TaxID=3079858 RepID=UPI0032DDB1BD
MKNIILFSFIIGIAYNINSQCDHTLPVYEDFSNTFAVNSCWTYIDDDGDGLGWSITSLDGSGNKGLKSKSFAGTALTPDNWIISNSINLPSSGSIELTWKVRATYWQYDAENYSVYVATGNSQSDFTSSSVMFTENLVGSDASGSFANRSLNISSLAGQTVYIAFRHHGVTDQFEIDIDDFSITSNGNNGCSIDSDNDGVCDANDVCPGFDDTIDSDGDGIPDGCDTNGCIEYTADFSDNPLTHSGSGSSATGLSFPNDSQDISFTISGINDKSNGKASSQYTEKVEVHYVDGSGSSRVYGTYNGANVNSTNINIQGNVQSVSVILSDSNGSTSSNMTINFSSVTYCSSDNTPPCNDSDGDGVCDDVDQCPGYDDTIDSDGDGIPDGCETTGCTEYTTNFTNNPLTHSGLKSTKTTLSFPANSQDIAFSISNIDEKVKGKRGTYYRDLVNVTFTDEFGGVQTYGNFSGSGTSSVSVDIPNKVQSVTISLSNDLALISQDVVLSINFSSVSYCSSSSQASRSFINSKSSEQNTSVLNDNTENLIKIFPNPASESLYVKFGELNEKPSNILLYSIDGRLMRNINLSSQARNSTKEINLNGISSGLYLLKVINQNGSVLKVKRIVVN